MQWKALVLVNDTRGTVKNLGGAVDTLVRSQLFKAVSTRGGRRVFLKAVVADKFIQYHRPE